VCVALISTGRGVFIGVQGGVTDLVKLVTRQVVADRPSHVASWPWSSSSTDLQLGIPLYHLLESVIVMQPTRGCKVGLASDPLGPLVSGLCTLPPHVRYTPWVTLILVEF
jgi:hypothetical protein